MGLAVSPMLSDRKVDHFERNELVERNLNDKDESDDWMAIIDRGGLTHIGNVTFCVLVCMELEIKQFFNKHPTQLDRVKQTLHKNVTENDDVQFYWALLSAGWGVEESEKLLDLIVEHYVTIRGFSFCSGWMEKYKQANKKSTQKSKGLRKQLL